MIWKWCAYKSFAFSFELLLRRLDTDGHLMGHFWREGGLRLRWHIPLKLEASHMVQWDREESQSAVDDSFYRYDGNKNPIFHSLQHNQEKSSKNNINLSCINCMRQDKMFMEFFPLETFPIWFLGWCF